MRCYTQGVIAMHGRRRHWDYIDAIMCGGSSSTAADQEIVYVFDSSTFLFYPSTFTFSPFLK